MVFSPKNVHSLLILWAHLVDGLFGKSFDGGDILGLYRNLLAHRAKKTESFEFLRIKLKNHFRIRIKMFSN